MVWKLECECAERYEAEIDSWKLFQEIKEFFEGQVDKGVFEDISNYDRIWYEHGGQEKNIYRRTIKCYKCKVCGCLWEFTYPDFPGIGNVRKFPDGAYTEEGY